MTHDDFYCHIAVLGAVQHADDLQRDRAARGGPRTAGYMDARVRCALLELPTLVGILRIVMGRFPLV